MPNMVSINIDLLWQYWALAISAFTSATILPGTSDVALAAFVHAYPQAWLNAFLVASVFNGLGSIASYGMGRLLLQKKQPHARIKYWLDRYGVWTLLLAWVPIVGDGLPIAAGWLRMQFWWSCLALMVGKFTRYAVLVYGVLSFS